MKVINIAIVAMLGAGLVVSSATPSEARGGWAAHHPRRAEVMGRDQNLNHRINAHAGNLDGHYGQLKREDRAIKRQQRMEARANGGHITKQEQMQLNREENHLSNQIRRDR